MRLKSLSCAVALGCALTTGLSVVPALAAAAPAPSSSSPDRAVRAQHLREQLRAGLAAQRAETGSTPTVTADAGRGLYVFRDTVPGQVLAHHGFTVEAVFVDPAFYGDEANAVSPTGTVGLFVTGPDGTRDPSAPALGEVPLQPDPDLPGVSVATYDAAPSGTFPQPLQSIALTYSGDATFADVPEDDAIPVGTEVVDEQPGARREVQRLYFDLLHRAVDQEGLDYWRPLTQQRGPADAAWGLSTSDEKYGRYIASAYLGILGRPVDGEGLAYYLSLFRSGFPLERLLVDLLESPELGAEVGSDNGAYLTAVYERVLGREPDADGFDYYKGLLDTGRIARGGVAYDVSYSEESLVQELDGVYVELLDRPVDDGGAAYWAAAIRGGYPLQLVEYSITRSDEYRTLLDDQQ